MSGRLGVADPWETVPAPSGQHRVSRTPRVERIGGPERIYDAAAADPKWKSRAVGFTADIAIDVEPLTWDGDDA